MTDLKERFLAKVRVSTETGCWEWTADKNENGYGRIQVGRKSVLAHRVSYELHRGLSPGGMHVLHRCDNPSCVNPEHLMLGTHTENVADMVAKRRHPLGTAHGRAKLTEDDVRAIRAAKGVTQRELGHRYGVNNEQISRIRRGKLWKHLTQDTHHE